MEGYFDVSTPNFYAVVSAFSCPPKPGFEDTEIASNFIWQTLRIIAGLVESRRFSQITQTIIIPLSEKADNLMSVNYK